jgi:hypothetical protein
MNKSENLKNLRYSFANKFKLGNQAISSYLEMEIDINENNGIKRTFFDSINKPSYLIFYLKRFDEKKKIENNDIITVNFNDFGNNILTNEVSYFQ